MRPLIGIPPSLDERGRWRPGRSYHYLDEAYARAVAESGALPVYLPIQPEPERLLERLDGLLLPGGESVNTDNTRVSKKTLSRSGTSDPLQSTGIICRRV